MSFPAGLSVRARVAALARNRSRPGQSALVVKNRAAFQARYGTGARLEDRRRMAGRQHSTTAARKSACSRATELDRRCRSPTATAPAGLTARTATAARSNTPAPRIANADSDNSGELALVVRNSRQPRRHRRRVRTARIVINEILSSLELAARRCHRAAQQLRRRRVNVGGWFISDVGTPESVLEFKRFRIPAGTIIPAGGYAVFTEVQFNPNGAWNPAPGTPGPNEFAFDGQHGDDAWLVSADAGGNLLKFIDHVDFGAARADESWGRFPNGTGLAPAAASRGRCSMKRARRRPRPGLGADNSSVRVGPLIIQEIHHAPPGGNTDLEFVELFNPTAAAVSLAHWRLRGDADYNFLRSESIPAGGLSWSFRSTPTIPPRPTPSAPRTGSTPRFVLAGPWDSGDHLGHRRPGDPLPRGTPPAGRAVFLSADDRGRDALPRHRQRLAKYHGGRLAQSLVRNDPSCPRAGSPAPPRRVTCRLDSHDWKTVYFPSGGIGSGDHDDPDGDGFDNALEFALRTDPLTASSAAASLPVVTSQPGPGESTDFQFTYTRALDRPGVSYAVARSSNLTSWTVVPDTSVSMRGRHGNAPRHDQFRRSAATFPAAQHHKIAP